jgi:hypothetical protein
MQRTRTKGNDAEIIRLLATGRTVESVAIEVQIDRSTIFRKLRNPDFQAELDKIRSESLQRIADTLATSSTQAIVTLSELSKSAKSEMVRAVSARAILDLTIQLATMQMFERRIAQIEERLTEENVTLRRIG